MITVTLHLSNKPHKMKSFVAVLALVAVAAADVSHLNEASAQILRQEADVNPDSYSYNFETSNGIAAQESGVLKNVGQEQALEVQGQNQYTAPDGTPIQTSYVANEFGYQPQGSHLPTPPPPQPIPEYIARALKWIEAHPAKPEVYQAPVQAFQQAYQAPVQPFRAASSAFAGFKKF